MNVIDLRLGDGTEAGVYVCGKCGRVWAGYWKGQPSPNPTIREDAESCCTCKRCQKPLPDAKMSMGYHEDCWSAYCRERWLEQLEKATEVKGYDGWVYNDGLGGGPQEGYACDMESLVEYLEDKLGDDLDEKDWPEFVLCCNPSRVPKLDVQDFAERMTECLYEDAYEDLEGLDQLQVALDKFNKANAHLTSYEPDYKHKVAVPKPSREQA